jgi:NAD(P)-dependent dehydrogenase (short-subunit alcohol dehydrogenase family)
MPYLVTGASSGIGRAGAVHLAEHGREAVAGVRRTADAPVHSLISAADQEDGAAVVERALTVSRPPERYLSRDDARMTVELSRRLPARDMDEMLCRAMGLPEGTSDQ